jgi:hypothetical protein
LECPEVVAPFAEQLVAGRRSTVCAARCEGARGCAMLHARMCDVVCESALCGVRELARVCDAACESARRRVRECALQ